MPKTYVKDGSSWREITKKYIKDGSTWREITKTWINHSGTWRQVFQLQQAIELTISSNTNNVNIKSLADAHSDYSAGLGVILTINGSVTVGSSSSSNPAMTTGSGWAADSVVTIINNGSIVGANGSAGSTGSSGGSGSSGSNGSVSYTHLTLPTNREV